MVKVLIVEDDATKLAATVSVIINTGLASLESLETAPDATTARNRLLKEHYDLLILDISIPNQLGELPNSNAGHVLLRDLNEDDNYFMPSRIIGLTAYNNIATELSADFQSYGVILAYYNPLSTNWHAPITMQLRQIKSLKSAEQGTTKPYGAYLGIVCAIDVEFNAIQNLPWSFKDVLMESDSTICIEGSFLQYGIRRKVVAALCPRMGMSAAAITATKLIEVFRPEIIAMTGITGAIRGQANIGDVLIAEECWDWGIGKWERKKNKLLFFPGPHHIGLEEDLRLAATRLSRDEVTLSQIRKDWPGAKPDTVLSAKIGPIASGSAVIAAQQMTDHIKAQHRKLIGIDMEAYAVYSAAVDASHPRPRAISLKAASDFADEEKDDNFRHYCAYTSANVLKCLAEKHMR